MATYRAQEIIGKLDFSQRKGASDFFKSSRGLRPQLLRLYQTILTSPCPEQLTKSELQKLGGLPIKRLDDLMNKLLDELESYLARNCFNRETTWIAKQRYLLDFYSHAGMSNCYEYCLNKTLKKLKPTLLYDADQYWELFHLFYDISIHDKLQKARKSSYTLADFNRYLDLSYCLAKLKLDCEALNRNRVLNVPIELTISPLTEWQRQYSKESILIESYLLVLNYLKTSTISVKEFDRLFHLMQNIPQIGNLMNEKQTLCHYMINMSLRLIKAGDAGFRHKFLTLVKAMESFDILLERNILSAPIFMATIHVGGAEYGVQFAAEFLKKYERKLPEYNGPQIATYGRALLSFLSNEYDNSQRILDKIETANMDVYFKIDIHKLRIKIFTAQFIYHSTIDISIIERLLRNFGVFLNSNQIGKDNLNQLKKFNLYVKKVCSNYSVKRRREAVFSQLLLEKNIAEKDWLLSLKK